MATSMSIGCSDEARENVDQVPLRQRIEVICKVSEISLTVTKQYICKLDLRQDKDLTCSQLQFQFQAFVNQWTSWNVFYNNSN